nr:hypothetical protein 9 [Spirochaetaceae bacterium]
MHNLQAMPTPELLRLRQKVERDPQYRAPLAGFTPEGRRLIQKIQDEIERRVKQ